MCGFIVCTDRALSYEVFMKPLLYNRSFYNVNNAVTILCHLWALLLGGTSLWPPQHLGPRYSCTPHTPCIYTPKYVWVTVVFCWYNINKYTFLLNNWILNGQRNPLDNHSVGQHQFFKNHDLFFSNAQLHTHAVTHIYMWELPSTTLLCCWSQSSSTGAFGGEVSYFTWLQCVWGIRISQTSCVLLCCCSCWTQRTTSILGRYGTVIAPLCWLPSRSTATPPSTWASWETSTPSLSTLHPTPLHLTSSATISPPPPFLFFFSLLHFKMFSSHFFFSCILLVSLTFMPFCKNVYIYSTY